MQIFETELESKIKIRAYTNLQSFTYEGGVAVGKHSRERVSRNLAILNKQAKQIVENAPVYDLLPPETVMEQRGWLLPCFTFITWFESDYTGGGDYDGTHLAVIHFQNTNHPIFDQISEQQLQQIDWTNLASGFLY